MNDPSPASIPLVSHRDLARLHPTGAHPEHGGRLAALHAAFPDLRSAVEDLIEAEDKVIYRGKLRGTNEGELLGMEPTGACFEVTEIHINRFVDGKIVEHWGLVDEMGVMEQLGGGPP